MDKVDQKMAEILESIEVLESLIFIELYDEDSATVYAKKRQFLEDIKKRIVLD